MNCDQVLQFIDALSPGERKVRLQDRIQNHLDHCQNCQFALDSVVAMEDELKSLAEPEAPPSLIAAINAHTALHDRQRESKKNETFQPVRKTQRNHLSTLAFGAAMALIALIFRILSGEWKPDFITPPFYQRREDFLAMMEGSPATLILGSCLVLLVIGLFASGEKASRP